MNSEIKTVYDHANAFFTFRDGLQRCLCDAYGDLQRDRETTKGHKVGKGSYTNMSSAGTEDETKYDRQKQGVHQ